MQTRELYEKRQSCFNRLSVKERKAATRAIANSCPKDYREYIDSIITDMENAIKSGNTRKLNRLIKQLSKKSNPSPIMSAKDVCLAPQYYQPISFCLHGMNFSPKSFKYLTSM